MFHQNKNIFDILFEAIPEGVIVVNNAQIIVAANSSAEKMFGYNSKELNNQNLSVLIPKRYAIHHNSHFNLFLKNKKSKKPLLVACDVYRPAAINQLEILAEQVGVDVFTNIESKDPVEIAKSAITYAKQNGHIDYFKDLTNNGTGTSSLGVITFNLKSDKDSNFTWHPSTYPYYDVFFRKSGETVFNSYTSTITIQINIVSIDGTLDVYFGELSI